MNEKLTVELDLDDYENVNTGTLVLKNPQTGEPTKSTILLASKEHENRKRIDLARTRKLRAAFTKTGKMPNTDPVEDIEEETDYLVASTLGWNLTQGGKPLLFSAEAARAIYTDPKRQWVRDQVTEALKGAELFISSSAKP